MIFLGKPVSTFPDHALEADAAMALPIRARGEIPWFREG
jgi:hypothetical protein